MYKNLCSCFPSIAACRFTGDQFDKIFAFLENLEHNIPYTNVTDAMTGKSKEAANKLSLEKAYYWGDSVPDHRYFASLAGIHHWLNQAYVNPDLVKSMAHLFRKWSSAYTSIEFLERTTATPHRAHILLTLCVCKACFESHLTGHANECHKEAVSVMASLVANEILQTHEPRKCIDYSEDVANKLPRLRLVGEYFEEYTTQAATLQGLQCANPESCPGDGTCRFAAETVVRAHVSLLDQPRGTGGRRGACPILDPLHI